MLKTKHTSTKISVSTVESSSKNMGFDLGFECGEVGAVVDVFG